MMMGGKEKFLFLFDFRQCKTEMAKFSQEKGIRRHTSLKNIEKYGLLQIPYRMSKTGGGEGKEDGKGEKEKKLPPPSLSPFLPWGV